jgi:hypothetical protein
VSGVHCPPPSDFVQLLQTLSGWHRTLSGVQKIVQRLVFWERSINIPTPLTALSLGHMRFLVLKLILSISKGLKHSTLEHTLHVLDLGIEWSQDLSFMCESHLQAYLDTWIFILHAFYSWSFAPRQLEIALELPLCVVSLGKFVLPLCDSEQLKVRSLWSLEWGKGGERSDSLWAPQRGHMILCEFESQDKILCLLSLCIYLLCCCLISCLLSLSYSRSIIA